jgi:hypothetical protein
VVSAVRVEKTLVDTHHVGQSRSLLLDLSVRFLTYHDIPGFTMTFEVATAHSFLPSEVQMSI